jgi:hypothetical protein
MLVAEVYVKAGWEIVGGDDDVEGRARKSEFEAVPHSGLVSVTFQTVEC